MRINLLRSEKKERYFLVLDIGTEAVKSLIFEQKKQSIIILGASTQYFDRFGVFDSAVFERDVIKKAISGAIEEASKTKNIEKPKLLLQLPANVLRAKVLHQNFLRKNPKVVIEKKEKQEIIKRIIEKAKKQIFEIYGKEGILPQDIIFFDSEILEIKIDGYEVEDILKYDGKNLDFKVLITLSLKYPFQNFKNILQDLNLKPLILKHEAQSLINVIVEQISDAIFLDIGGKISQVFLVKKGKLKLIENLEVGGEDFSQALCQNLGINLTRSRTLKERYSKRLLSEKVRRRIRKILDPVFRDWFFNLKLKLAKFKILMPSNIFLFGGASLLPEIQEILERDRWEDVSFLSPPKTKLIFPTDLKDFVFSENKPISVKYETKKLISPEYIPALLLCFYYARKEIF